jgi:predicted RNA-binding protein YlxR (DUF448 family)
MYEELGDVLGEISSLLNMGSVYVITKRKKLARSCYLNAQQLAEQVEDKSLLEKVKQFMDAL